MYYNSIIWTGISLCRKKPGRRCPIRRVESPMELVKLLAVFLVIVLLLKLHQPLSLAVIGGVIAAILLFQIPLLTAGKVLVASSISHETLVVILFSLYEITYLQRILESRDQLNKTAQDLNGIFHNRRINAAMASVFVGLLPSAAASKICSSIVDSSVGDDLPVDEKAFITSYYRHIPESFLPTYTAVILMTELSGVDMVPFILYMLPMIVVLYALGYIYLRKVPKHGELTQDVTKLQALGHLFQHLWSLFAILVLIIGFHMSVYASVGIVIVLSLVVYRITLKEMLHFVVSAFEPSLLISSYVIMLFKGIIEYTGILNTLAQSMSTLPIAPFLIFAVVFFIGSVIAGSKAIIAICTTMAFAAIPDGGVPLMILLMGSAYAAMQISPTHVCLFVVADYYKIELGAMIKKTLVPIFLYWAVLFAYYLLLRGIL